MRLDSYLFDHGMSKSRTYSSQIIKEGLVFVNEKQCLKPSFEVRDNDDIIIKDHQEYASAGSKKLLKAFNDFNLNVENLVCADIGASNGGFTDVLLKEGAKKVFAVDVGDCALPPQIKNDIRVIVKDNLNARFLTEKDIGEKVDFVTVDVSFISLKLILPSVYDILKDGGACIALVKPQFELNKKALSKSGIVKNDSLRKEALNSVISYLSVLKFNIKETTVSPIVFGKNIEYLIYIFK